MPKKKRPVVAIGFWCALMLSGCQNTDNTEAKEIRAIESVKQQQRQHVTSEQTVEKYVAKEELEVSCDVATFTTVYWEAIGQEAQFIITPDAVANSQAKTASFRLKLADGTTLDFGNATIAGGDASDATCSEHLKVTADSILKSLSGERTLSDENVYFKNYANLYGYNATALECHQPSTPLNRSPIPYEYQTQPCKAAIDHWNIFSEYGRIANRHSKQSGWTNERNLKLVSLKAPIVYVTRSKSCTDILVYDPIDKIMRLVMPTNLECVIESE